MPASNVADKGWNDPPKMEYSAATTKPRRTLLNKRVAYPLSGVTETSSAPEVQLVTDSDGPPLCSNFQILPPASTTDTPRPVPLLLPMLDPNQLEDLTSNLEPSSHSSPVLEDLEKDDHFMNNDLALKSLMEKFKCGTDEELLDFVICSIEQTFRICGDALTERAQEEVSRKLDLFKECWLQSRLPDIVKIRMTHLASALHKGHYDIANEIHLTLIVDHTAVVNQWMVGIKRVVQEAMKRVNN